MTRAYIRGLVAVSALLLATSALALVPGEEAPDFTLDDTAGVAHTLSAELAEGHVVVLEWFNPDCPFIRKHHASHKTMNETFADFAERGVVWLAVNSNARGKQGAGLLRNRKALADYHMTFPILLDESGEVGRAYGAKTTPHMFVIGTDGMVAYEGAIDDAPDPKEMGSVNYVADALRAVLDGEDPEPAETRPYGCSVKYGE